MTHSQHIELTSLLQGFTANAGTLRLVFSTVEAPADPDTLEPGRPATKPVPSDQAKQHPGYRFRYRMLDNEEKAVRETLELMDGTVDTWTDENQARADKGLGPTADFRVLFNAMVGFMSATETPVDGAGGLYIRLRNKVRAWIDQAEIWSPELKLDRLKITNPTLRKILASQEYRDKVREKRIIEPYTWDEPFIWVGSIVGLARWLGPVLEIPKVDNVTDSNHDWTPVDGVFMINGKRVTGKQLSDAYRNG